MVETSTERDGLLSKRGAGDVFSRDNCRYVLGRRRRLTLCCVGLHNTHVICDLCHVICVLGIHCAICGRASTVELILRNVSGSTVHTSLQPSVRSE